MNLNKQRAHEGYICSISGIPFPIADRNPQFDGNVADASVSAAIASKASNAGTIVDDQVRF
jgi:hypothetical protein